MQFLQENVSPLQKTLPTTQGKFIRIACFDNSKYLNKRKLQRQKESGQKKEELKEWIKIG